MRNILELLAEQDITRGNSPQSPALDLKSPPSPEHFSKDSAVKTSPIICVLQLILSDAWNKLHYNESLTSNYICQ